MAIQRKRTIVICDAIAAAVLLFGVMSWLITGDTSRALNGLIGCVFIVLVTLIPEWRF